MTPKSWFTLWMETIAQAKGQEKLAAICLGWIFAMAAVENQKRRGDDDVRS